MFSDVDGLVDLEALADKIRKNKNDAVTPLKRLMVSWHLLQNTFLFSNLDRTKNMMTMTGTHRFCLYSSIIMSIG